MRLHFLVAAFAVLIGSCVSSPRPAEPTRVMAIASMHGMHDNHPTYDFDALYALVEAQKPDFVGVEIRPEDMGAEGDYLSRSYPPEMIVLMKKYGPRAFGFDWLGPEIADRRIPDNWWKEQSEVKGLERRLGADEAMRNPRDDALSEEQGELLKAATAASLADGRYHRLVRERRRLAAEMAGTGPYVPLVKFTQDRERHIGDNIVRMIRQNPGKRFVLVIGADHHGFQVERLRQELGDEILLQPVP